MAKTKKSFILSLLSLMLCIAMLIGTTYAWFTDSVTSGRNKIIAGNLDVELYHSGSGLPDTTKDADKIGSNTEIFKVNYWEPGMIVYENFAVANVGTLALKYQFKLNTFKYNSYNGHDLTEVLKVAVVENGFSGDRAAAQALTNYVPLSEFAHVGNGWLEAGKSSDPFGVVIYWEPGDNDNLYNVNNYTGTRPTSDGEPLYVEFGAELFATQKDFEVDSFDKNYDLTAADFAETSVEPIVKPLIVPVDPTDERVVRAPEAGETLTLDVKNQDMTVTYTVGTKLTSETALASDKKTADAKLGFEFKSETSGMGVTVAAGQKLANYELTLNIDQENNILNKVTKVIPKNLVNVVAYHNSTTPMTKLASATAIPETDKESYFYDSATGILTVWVFHASEIDITYDIPDLTITKSDNTKVSMTFKEFADFVNAGNNCEGWIVSLNKDVDLKYDINYYGGNGHFGVDPIGVTSAKAFKGTFDGKGYTIKNFHKECMDSIGLAGVFGYVENATIKNLTVSNFSTMSFGSSETVGGVAAIANGNCTFENITVDHCRLNAYLNSLGGIIGYVGSGHVDLKNINVPDTTVLSSTYLACDTSIGGLIGSINITPDSGATVSFDNCTISAKVMPLNDIMSNNLFYTYRNSGMIIGALRDVNYSGNGNIKTATDYLLENTIVTCKDVTVNYGKWAKQYYAYIPDFVSKAGPKGWARVTDDLNVVEDRKMDAYDDNNETWGKGFITLGLDNVRYKDNSFAYVHLVTIEGKKYVVASTGKTVNSLGDALAYIETSEFTKATDPVSGNLDEEIFDALFGVEQFDSKINSLKTYSGVTVNYNY